MIFEALVDECVNKGVDAGVERDDNNADDVGYVTVFLILVEEVEHIDDQHWEPCDAVHNAYLQTNEVTSLIRVTKNSQGYAVCLS